MKPPSTTTTVSGSSHHGASRRSRAKTLVVTPASPTPAPLPDPASSVPLTVIQYDLHGGGRRPGPAATLPRPEDARHATESRCRVGLAAGDPVSLGSAPVDGK